jgi:hypothetical protein
LKHPKFYNIWVQKALHYTLLSSIRRNYESEGISRNATNIILASWRRSTQKQYATYISKWILFCDKRKINSVCPTLNQVLEFLNSLFESGRQDVCCILLLRTSSPRCMLYITSAYFYTTYILAKKYTEVIYNIHLGEEVRRSNMQHTSVNGFCSVTQGRLIQYAQL